MSYTDEEYAKCLRSAADHINDRIGALMSISSIDENAENLKIEVKANKRAALVLEELAGWFTASADTIMSQAMRRR